MRVAESADDAVSSAEALDLNHPFAVTGVIGLIGPLRYDAVTPELAVITHPALRFVETVGDGREADAAVLREFARKCFQRFAPFMQGKVDERLPFRVHQQIECE